MSPVSCQQRDILRPSVFPLLIWASGFTWIHPVQHCWNIEATSSNFSQKLRNSFLIFALSSLVELLSHGGRKLAHWSEIFDLSSWKVNRSWSRWGLNRGQRIKKQGGQAKMYKLSSSQANNTARVEHSKIWKLVSSMPGRTAEVLKKSQQFKYELLMNFLI